MALQARAWAGPRVGERMAVCGWEGKQGLTQNFSLGVPEISVRYDKTIRIPNPVSNDLGTVSIYRYD